MILAVLQARMSSSRLPAKVLAPVLGRAMVLRQIDRLRRSRRIDRLVVATSTAPSDDPLVEALRDAGVEVRRGPLEDVLARFALVVGEMAPDQIVRLTADCPLADPAVIDAVIERQIVSGADYTSNVLPRTFPRGLDVEVVSASAFARLLELELSDDEREHVTMGIHRRQDRFAIENVIDEVDRSELRWTVDYPEDLDFVRAVYERLFPSDPAFDSAAVRRLLDEVPGLRRTESDADASH